MLLLKGKSLRSQSIGGHSQNESIFLLGEDDVCGRPNLVSSRITEEAVEMELAMFQCCSLTTIHFIEKWSLFNSVYTLKSSLFYYIH